ncbi:MAG: hypothetical protein M1831_004353 [Alyxoria varia]|nr:MAG: hypothetical protein M1831_004353 [Alyxoria varia]
MTMNMSSKEHEEAFQSLEKTLDHFFINITAYANLIREISPEEQHRIINATDASTVEEREKLSRDRERLARYKERVARASIKMKGYLLNQREEAYDALDVLGGALYHAKDVLRKELVLRNKDTLLSNGQPVQAQDMPVDGASHTAVTTNETDDLFNDIIMTDAQPAPKPAEAQAMEDNSKEAQLPDSSPPSIHPTVENIAEPNLTASKDAPVQSITPNVDQKSTETADSATKPDSADPVPGSSDALSPSKDDSNKTIPTDASNDPDLADQTTATTVNEPSNTMTALENPSPGDLLPGLEMYANDPAKDLADTDLGDAYGFPSFPQEDQNTDNFLDSGGEFDFLNDSFGQVDNPMDTTNLDDYLSFDADINNNTAGTSFNETNDLTNDPNLGDLGEEFFNLGD